MWIADQKPFRAAIAAKFVAVSCLLASVAVSVGHADDSNAQGAVAFIHPGISHTQESIDFVKQRLAAGEQPWKDAWEKLTISRGASLSFTPTPYAHVERGAYNNPNIGSSEFSRDTAAAHTQAVLWVLTDDEAHAKKAAEILDAWSGTLKSISNHDAILLIGMSGHRFCNAAELLKHNWDGWPDAKQKQFEKMIREIWYPIIKDFFPSANGNWDASVLQTMIAMAIYLDDQPMFDRAVNYFRAGKGNGAIGNYFNEFGQCQESGRDQAHTQMGLEYLATTCEIAWNQGIDLYGELDNRLLKGFEYTAKYNLGFDVPYEPYRSYQGRYYYESISDDSRGRFRPMYEKVLNHYQNRKGMEAPFTKQVVMKIRQIPVEPYVEQERDDQDNVDDDEQRTDRDDQRADEARSDDENRDRRRRRRRRNRSGRAGPLQTLMFADQPASFR